MFNVVYQGQLTKIYQILPEHLSTNSLWPYHGSGTSQIAQNGQKIGGTEERQINRSPSKQSQSWKKLFTQQFPYIIILHWGGINQVKSFYFVKVLHIFYILWNLAPDLSIVSPENQLIGAINNVVFWGDNIYIFTFPITRRSRNGAVECLHNSLGIARRDLLTDWTTHTRPNKTF